MKLATLLLSCLVGMSSLAAAAPPSEAPGAVQAGPDDFGPAGDQGPRQRPQGPRGLKRGGPRGQARQALLARFDRNGDGRLEPQERRKAARALRRMANRLEAGGPGGKGGRGGKANRRAALIRRYDLNGDGNVGPGEVPPAVARKLRRFDTNQDGWVDGRDAAPRGPGERAERQDR